MREGTLFLPLYGAGVLSGEFFVCGVLRYCVDGRDNLFLAQLI